MAMGKGSSFKEYRASRRESPDSRTVWLSAGFRSERRPTLWSYEMANQMKTHESISRRKFLVNAALTAGTVAVSNLDWPAWPAGVSAAPPATAAGWYDRPMRWAQLTLVEDDPGKYDPAFWLDYFRRTH